jgi:hypothetical protein
MKKRSGRTLTGPVISVFQKSIPAAFRARRFVAIGLGYRRPTVTSAAPLQFLIRLVASWIGRR